MAFLRANDTISGQEGKAFVKIGERMEEMFYIKTLEATVEKEKAELKTMGQRAVQHKAIGWKGSGTMTIYYVTTLFRELMMEYIQTGKDVYFMIEVRNEDPGSATGRQTVILEGVNLDSVIMASLDTEAEALEEEVAFTFENVRIETPFTPLA
ncbi:phage portal protein [Bacillus sp. FJAT-18019]|uniref:Phage portal protein n=1 Tax=Paenibacillus solani TaxID=1705565 RepID=A0A0M1NK95_9BACL|nr:phage tail tube protein [Paenibacillus solani]KOP66651.1 phage portal protein [Bacillus sp. FJAT-18019]KOR82527.1 phage portal protein [Paenibacillus solani]